MAYFAELDKNNVVIRVLAACNDDITNNGGEQSDEAAEHFKTIISLSQFGVKWIQTSLNGSFRKQFAGEGDTYDTAKDKFIRSQPFASWVLDENDDWVAPVEDPNPAFPGRSTWNESTGQWDIS
tara:strand:- start:1598 stop:1969 length:372 start_codon:yes stop_codon:yes gene_type:complete